MLYCSLLQVQTWYVQGEQFGAVLDKPGADLLLPPSTKRPATGHWIQLLYPGDVSRHLAFNITSGSISAPRESACAESGIGTAHFGVLAGFLDDGHKSSGARGGSGRLATARQRIGRSAGGQRGEKS